VFWPKNRKITLAMATTPYEAASFFLTCKEDQIESFYPKQTRASPNAHHPQEGPALA
jgi:hypothetical protein